MKMSLALVGLIFVACNPAAPDRKEEDPLGAPPEMPPRSSIYMRAFTGRVTSQGVPLSGAEVTVATNFATTTGCSDTPLTTTTVATDSNGAFRVLLRRMVFNEWCTTISVRSNDRSKSQFLGALKFEAVQDSLSAPISSVDLQL